MSGQSVRVTPMDESKLPIQPASPSPQTPSAMPAIPGARHVAMRLLRRMHEGTLGFEERRAEVRFVLDGATGMMVIPVEPGFARIHELTLTAPSESSMLWQTMLSPRIIERPEAEESVDRWAAYHGKAPGGAVWVRCEIGGLKSAGEVWGNDECVCINALRGVEPRLIRALNADRPALCRACKVHGPVDVADPLCVGIDALGIDIRARFGIVRLEFPENVEAADEAGAQRAIDFLLGRRAWSDSPRNGDA